MGIEPMSEAWDHNGHPSSLLSFYLYRPKDYRSCRYLEAKLNAEAVMYYSGPRIELAGDALTHGRRLARSYQSKSSN
jgi:hypothetical protein